MKEKINKKKILILTASPVRDLAIDEMLAEHLRKMGNDVWVKSCLREGRQAVLDLQPNIVVTPPIRNLYSRDFVEILKDWGIGVVSRHTEASCGWQDFKQMDGQDKQQVLGPFPYMVDMEIVWSEDEAEILRKRNYSFPVYSVGSFAVDVYKLPDLASKYLSREAFCERYKFNKEKKTILILSAWGFLDAAPDLRVDEQDTCDADQEGRNKWIEMIKLLHASLNYKFNILVTIHPGVCAEHYKKELDKLAIPIDTTSQAVEMVMNSDVIVHAGSTTALGAHFLNKPSFQYGDQNQKLGWLYRSNSPISHVSPYAKDINQLIELITTCQYEKSNASEEAIKQLEDGRYGLMDGQATFRAAELINKLTGHFSYCWPRAHRDYNQPTLYKDPGYLLQPMYCGICHNKFVRLKPDWMMYFVNLLNIPNDVKAKAIPPYPLLCPHCGAKMYMQQ